MDFSTEELNQIFKIFKYETEERIANVNKALMKLEESPDDATLIDELFREAHSIKGSARMVGALSVQKLAHKIEDLLKLVKDGAITISSDIIDILYEGTDSVKEIVENISLDKLEYTDKNYIKIIYKIDYISDNITLQEKKKNANEAVPVNPELDDAVSLHKFIKKQVALLDNKQRKNEALGALLSMINNELSKGIPQQEKDILETAKGNLLFIQENDILPPKEINQIIEQSLVSLGKNLSEEEIVQAQNKQQSIKKLLELYRDKQNVFEKEKSADILVKNEIKQTNKVIPEVYIDNIFKTLRVDTYKLDKLEKQAEELLVLKIKNRQHLRILKNAIDELNEIQKNVNKSINYLKDFEKEINETNNPQRYPRTVKKQLDKASLKIDFLQNEMEEFQKKFYEDDSKLNLLSNEIDSTVKNIRILPIATILHMFPRMVRDIARTQGKQVEIIISGSETGADKTIIEELKTPLVHIVNNAIDHGIEPPEERIKKGKNPTGKIILNSYQLDNNMIIEISDDGQGLNINNIKKKAISENLLNKNELSTLSEYQILNFIFWPGFSTEEKATNNSGRGVGLDVVNTTISQLGGKISVQSKPDYGFKIAINIPISIAMLNVLLIKLGSQIFGIPSGAVKHVCSIIEEDIYTKEGKPYIKFAGMSVRYIKLAELLNYEDELGEPNKHDIVIIQSDETMLAIEVDELLRMEEVVQKKLAPPLSRIKNITGIASLTAGEPCFILNINDIINSVLSSKELLKKQTVISIPQNMQKLYNILIVDDSYTTLILEKNILKSAGFNPITATNGEEAIKKLTCEKIDLIVTDLEMPKMDGIELIQKIREKDTNIPIIVVTSHEEKLPNIYVQNYSDEIILKKDFSKQVFIQKIEKHLI